LQTAAHAQIEISPVQPVNLACNRYLYNRDKQLLLIPLLELLTPAERDLTCETW
jgi:hypothetical protein